MVLVGGFANGLLGRGSMTMFHAKKILIFNVPAFGHVNPTLGLVRELAERGHHVIAFCYEEFREYYENNGAEFRVYPDFHIDEIKYRPMYMSRMFLRLAIDNYSYIQRIIDQERPDRIICDFMASFAILVCRKIGFPCIVSWPVTVTTKRMIRMSIKGRAQSGFFDFVRFILSDIPEVFRFKRLASQFAALSGMEKIRLPLDLIQLRGDRNIVFTIPELQPGMDEITASYEDYVFVGPGQNGHGGEVSPGKPDQDRSLLYITMGTVFNRQPEFLRLCMRAFEDTNWQVVLTTGDQDVSNLRPYPKNFRVERFIPHADILPRAAVMIHHGGSNTLHDSIRYGVPSVIRPWGADQFINALQMEGLGAGVFIRSRRPAVSVLRTAVEDACNSLKIAESLNKLRRAMLSAGGTKMAADAVLAEL